MHRGVAFVQLAGSLDAGNVGVDTLVPVQEALDVDLVARFQRSESLVDIGVGTGQVTLDAEAIGSTVVGNIDIDVITGLTVLVVDSFDGQTLEADELVLVVDQSVGAKQSSDIGSLSNPSAIVDKLEGSVHDLDFASPSALVTGDADLSTLGQLCSVSLGASQLVDEVSAVGILCVDSDLVNDFRK